MYDDGMVDTDRNALRINTETGESVYFDSQPDGMLGQSDFYMRDNGAFVFSRRYAEYSSIYFIYNRSFQEIARENWEDENSFVWNSVITDQYFIRSSQSGIQVFSTLTGLLLNEFSFPGGADVGNTYLSNDGNNWICEAYQHSALMESFSISKYLLHGSFSNIFRVEIERTPELRSCKFIFRQQSNSNYLVYLQPRVSGSGARCVITDFDFTPLLAIPLPPYDFRGYMGSGNHIMMLSSSGDRLIYSTPDKVILVKIGE